MSTSFRANVLRAVMQIPKGGTATYKDIAKAAGSPRAFRAVGTILKNNFDPAIPCHRVIKSDGTPGQYNRGSEAKKAKLQSEGVLL